MTIINDNCNYLTSHLLQIYVLVFNKYIFVSYFTSFHSWSWISFNNTPHSCASNSRVFKMSKWSPPTLALHLYTWTSVTILYIQVTHQRSYTYCHQPENAWNQSFQWVKYTKILISLMTEIQSCSKFTTCFVGKQTEALDLKHPRSIQPLVILFHLNVFFQLYLIFI